MVARAMIAACARCRAVLFMVLLLPFEWTTRSGAMASAPFDKLKGGADAPSTSSGARAECRMSMTVAHGSAPFECAVPRIPEICGRALLRDVPERRPREPHRSIH